MKTDQAALDKFVYWVRERESIRQNRACGRPRPWTKDPILARYHFCNVRREDDRGTKERRGVVQNSGRGEQHLPWIYTASNLFNDFVSLNVILQAKNHDEWERELQGRLDNGVKVFHTAYVVSTCGEAMSKVAYCRRVIEAVEAAGDVPRDSCHKAFTALRRINGLGSFLAGQVVADLKNDRYLKDATDWHRFSVMGPGSKKGLDYIFGPGTTERTFPNRIGMLEALLPDDIRDMAIHRQDLQNCLCEFSKYWRYFNDLPGRSRPYV